MKIHRVKVPLYYGELRVIIADDFTKYGNFNNSVNDYPAISTIINDKKCHWGVFINPNSIDDRGLIAHEALHIVGYVFQTIKAKMDIDNDEPQCYLLGWVVDEIYKAVEKYKKYVNP